ncbi:MAG: hypothetical protein JNM00_01120 [Flavobacteriales bacterium]|nr:hypothetical protein [Flavobacteriales bacterium]
MKKILVILSVAFLLPVGAAAADLLVAEGGAGGAYANIMDAVTAASSGDRIIITPKAGGATWNENLTLTTAPNNGKSLQFLSATEGQYWKLNGNITYTPSAVGQSLTIMGCNITVGNITSGSNAPAGTRCNVVIMGCKLNDGYINFNHNYYNMNVGGDSLMNGYIYMRYGKVMGNFIDTGSLCAHSVNVLTDAAATNDVVYVIGNKIDCSSSGCGTLYGVIWQSSSQFYHISNNYIKQNASSQNSIYVSDSKTSTATKNKMMNNTCIIVNNNNLGIYVASFGSYHQLFGNVVQHVSGTNSGYGIGASSNSVFFEASYNYVSSNVAGQAFYVFTNDGTNVSGVTTGYDLNTGASTSGAALNGGHPDLQYSDIDLSRNDAGCFGGSWSRANFLNGSPTATQVTFFDAPGRVLVGNTISITGEGFDK